MLSIAVRAGGPRWLLVESFLLYFMSSLSPILKKKIGNIYTVEIYGFTAYLFYISYTGVTYGLKLYHRFRRFYEIAS